MMYTPTPNYYNEYIQHGYLKGQAAKTHKYIERWKNAAGKWVYKYKNAVSNLKTKINRWNTANRSFGFGRQPIYQWKADKPKKKNADMITTNYGKKMLWKGDTGLADSRAGRNGLTKAGIEAGRKRAKKKAITNKFNQHMANKSVKKGGYSGSRGTKTNNRATDKGLTAIRKKQNGWQYIITNNYGKDVSGSNFDWENVVSKSNRSRTGQRGSRVNSGIAAGRKRTGYNNNEKHYVSSKTNRKSKAYVNSKKKNQKSRKYIASKTRRKSFGD